MGDRANVKMTEDGGSVWFYTHSAGSRLPELVRQGLENGRSRFGDSPYLNRILFDALTKGYIGETTGFGIDFRAGDGDDRVIVVDHDSNTVYREGYPQNAVSFEVFIDSPGVSWSTLGGE